MKKQILLILTLASLLMGFTNASAHVNYRPYISGTGSVAWHNDWSITDGILTESLSHKIGGGGSIAIGLIMNQWRLEVEGLIRHNSLDSAKIEVFDITYHQEKVTGYTQDKAIMLNAFYDIPVQECVSIYLGAGLGATFQKIKFFNETATDTGIAWQLMAGISYDVSECVTLFTGYRLFGTPAHSTIKGVELKNHPLTHSVDFGVRFKF